jgi:hypothetical protein
MKLIEDTPARLVVEDRPWIIGTALTLSILLCLALAMGLYRESGWLTLGFGLASLLLVVLFVVFVRRVIVIFDRDARALVIRTRSLTGDSKTALALADVTGAEVETSRSTSTSNDGSRSVSVTHRPVLTTRTGPIPLTQVYSSGSGAETIAAAVNRWLSTR